MFSFDEFVQGLITSSGAKKLLGNPILTALIIVLIMVIVAYFIVEGIAEDSWLPLIRLSIYSGIASMAVMFLHHRVVTENFIRNGVDEHTKSLILNTRVDLADEYAEKATTGAAEGKQRAAPAPQTSQPPVVQVVLSQAPAPAQQAPPVPAQPVYQMPAPQYVRVA
jgi:hypothetical protein